MAHEDAAPPSEGRIKRHISGRTHPFALVFPPGLEQVGRNEALAWGIQPLAQDAESTACEEPSVLEWEGRLTDMYGAATALHVPSRVFVRLGRFRCGAREELFAAVRRIPWELWLRPCALRIDAHVAYSRISHEGMAAATVESAIQRRWQDCGLALPALGQDSALGPAPQRLLLRLQSNHAVLSLDCSGEGLWHRGWRREQGAAPLRENLAAGLLYRMGWPRTGLLVDGMCGSGTFVVEAVSQAAGTSPFHKDRRYAFMDWPSWQAAPWAWHQRQIFPGRPCGEARVIGVDWHQGVLAKARDNWACYSANRPSLQSPQFMEADFFGLEPRSLVQDSGEARFLILNPPYGLRLDDGGGNLFPRLWKHLDTVWKDWTLGVLAPDGQDPPPACRFAGGSRIRHGGLHINFWIRSPKE